MVKYLKTHNVEDCYGCGACEQICAHSAISLKPNEEGFLYPILESEKCTNCGLCTKVCPIDIVTVNSVKKTYAVQYKDCSLVYSASGGMFKAVADYVLAQGGYVAGCVFDEEFNAIHILSNSMEDIKRMQGSKYVQSKVGNVYAEVRKKLKENKLVLFSGTPCQVSGLRCYLLKDYENLITLDLICHGVPSPQFLQDYLNTTHRPYGKVVDFKFRNKIKNGWCSQGSVSIEVDNNIKEKRTSPFTDSYYYYYLQNSISRMCCYSCKYSSTNRVGDITIGDYWDLQNVLPDFDCKNGASVALVNTSKGLNILETIKSNLKLEETPLEEAVKGNGNLSMPCMMPESRKTIYSKIKKNGYREVEKEECHYQYVLPVIKRIIPKSFKRLIKRLLK